MTATAEYEKAKQTPQTGDTVRITYESTLGWPDGVDPRSPGVVMLGQSDVGAIYVSAGKDRKVISVEVIEPPEPAWWPPTYGDVIRYGNSTYIRDAENKAWINTWRVTIRDDYVLTAIQEGTVVRLLVRDGKPFSSAAQS